MNEKNTQDTAGSEFPVALALGPDFEDDFDWEYMSPDGLSTKDAWEMATAWQSELLGNITITYPDPEEAFSTFRNYEWIEICLGCGPPDGKLHRARAARAASIVWRALAALGGFRPSENPVFWKRLFNELQKWPDPKRADRCNHEFTIGGVTDVACFFVDLPFPRFRIRLSHYADNTDSLILAFCGLEDVTSSSLDAVAGQLKAILDRLARVPSCRRVDFSQPMELTLQLSLNEKNVEALNTLIGSISSHEAATVSSFRAPTYRVLKLEPSDIWWLLDSADTTRAFLDRRVRPDTLISRQHVRQNKWESLEDRTTFREYVLWAFGIDKKAQGGLQTLSLYQYIGVDVAEICSALPHARTLETLTLSTFGGQREMDEINAAWLGYALFHPKSAASSWRQLQLSKVSSNAPVNEALEMMAKGNNLRVAMGFVDKSAEVDGYFEATIRVGASIRSGASDDDPIVEQLNLTTKFDVCVASTELRLLDEWVFVVVPGYGHAWVHSVYIESIESRPPGEPFLTRLKLHICGFEEMHMVKLVELAGRELEYLDIGGLSHQARISVILPNLKVTCPMLRSLDLFALEVNNSSDLIDLPPSVRDVEGYIFCDSKSLRFSEFPLRHATNLRSLVLHMDDLPSADDVADFVVPLLRANPGLMYFQWKASYSREWRQDLTYSQWRFVTNHLLRELQPGRDDMIVVRGRHTTSALALMSAVKEHSQSTNGAIAQLDRYLVGCIFEFLGQTLKREFFVGRC